MAHYKNNKQQLFSTDLTSARPELAEGFERSILLPQRSLTLTIGDPVLQQVQDERERHTLVRCIYFLLFVVACFSYQVTHADISSLAKNDPYPVFSTLNLDDLFLLTSEQLHYKDNDWAQRKKSRFNFSISPFTQNADRGKSITGQPCPTAFKDDTPCASTTNTALGDLTGNANMLALLYGNWPAGTNSYPDGPTSCLSEAFSALFSDTSEKPGHLTNAVYLQPFGTTGSFSFPIKYRKRGVRFELDVRFWQDLGFRIQAGVSSIRQTIEARKNLTETSSPTEFEQNITTYLMDEVDNIADQMKLYIGDTNQAAAEEVRFNLFWRHAFEVNEESDYDWAHLLCIPYFEVTGSWSASKARHPNEVFAPVFGNNNHPSAGFTAGVNFDFIETIEIGAEASFTHFFKRNFENYPVPTSQYQRVFYPFQTDVSIQPGNNLLFGARLAAYHFVGNLSMYFEWFMIDHKKDDIDLKIPDPAFLPKVLEQTTSFKVKLANAALNYDISPNIGLGFLWQIPFSQRNAYRSSTLMAGINITF